MIQLEIRDWDSARDLASFSWRAQTPPGALTRHTSKNHFDYVCQNYGDPASVAKYQTIFVDSITVASRLAFQWAKGQPEAISERSGKVDTRGAYGLLGQEMITRITQLQHIGARNVRFVGLLDAKRDDFNRPYFEPQIEGSKTGLELPGIVDEVITMTELTPEGKLRAVPGLCLPAAKTSGAIRRETAPASSTWWSLRTLADSWIKYAAVRERPRPIMNIKIA